MVRVPNEAVIQNPLTALRSCRLVTDKDAVRFVSRGEQFFDPGAVGADLARALLVDQPR